MRGILDSDGMKTLILLMILFVVIMSNSALNDVQSLLSDATEKSQRPLIESLKAARSDLKRARTVIAGCFNGGTLMLKDGNLYHYAECHDYQVKSALVMERP